MQCISSSPWCVYGDSQSWWQVRAHSLGVIVSLSLCYFLRSGWIWLPVWRRQISFAPRGLPVSVWSSCGCPVFLVVYLWYRWSLGLTCSRRRGRDFLPTSWSAESVLVVFWLRFWCSPKRRFVARCVIFPVFACFGIFKLLFNFWKCL